jgi:hypothetical protein
MLGLDSAALKAGVVENLYQSELLVSDQLIVADELSLNAGIKEVLIKAGGVARAGLIAETLPRVLSAYIKEFRIEPTFQVLSDGRGNDFLAQRLIMQFDKASIDELLVSHRLKALGKYRPNNLIWLVSGSIGAVADEAGFDVKGSYAKGSDEKASHARRVNTSVAEYQYESITEAGLRRYADKVALPVQVVVNDDMRITQWVDAQQWQDISQYLTQYRRDFTIIGVIDGPTQSRWMLLNSDASEWQLFQGSIDEQLAQVFESLMQASGMIWNGAGIDKINSYQITVTRVKNMADYAAILEYIRSLSVVDRVVVVSMADKTLNLSLQSRLNKTVLIKMLGLERRMVLMRSLQPEVDGFLHWRWLSNRSK